MSLYEGKVHAVLKGFWAERKEIKLYLDEEGLRTEDVTSTAKKLITGGVIRAAVSAAKKLNLEIPYSNVKNVKLHEGFMKKSVEVEFYDPESGKTRTLELYPKKKDELKKIYSIISQKAGS